MGNGAPTIVVSFGDKSAAQSFFINELDDKMNVDLSGAVKTQFYPGDSVWFLLQYDSSVQVSYVKTSCGDLTFEGQVTRTKTDRLSFPTVEDTVELSHIPNGELVPNWFWTEALLKKAGITITADTAPSIGDITYDFVADLWRLDPIPADQMNIPAGKDFPILIVIFVDSVVA